jgi:hypothetical protein
MKICSLRKLTIGATAALAAISLSPASAQAACAPGTPAGTCRVTVNGLQYDVTTFLGTYDSNISKFAQPPAPGVMPWWVVVTDDTDLLDPVAAEFAAEVGGGLGTQQDGGVAGPLFGYFAYPCAKTGICVGGAFAVVDGPNAGTIGLTPIPGNISLVWASVDPALAVPVPGAIPLFGAAAAYGFSRKLRKRIKASSNAVSGTYSL